MEPSGLSPRLQSKGMVKVFDSRSIHDLFVMQISSLNLKYNRTCHTKYESENDNFGKERFQLTTVEELIGH